MSELEKVQKKLSAMTRAEMCFMMHVKHILPQPALHRCSCRIIPGVYACMMTLIVSQHRTFATSVAAATRKREQMQPQAAAPSTAESLLGPGTMYRL